MDKITAIILSGGTGTRFESSIPKQYMSLNGKLVIQYVIDEFQKAKLFHQIVIVLDKQYIPLLKNVKNITFASAGQTRNESIQNGLAKCTSKTKYVLFHDAARPFIKAEDLPQYLKHLKKNQAVVTAEEITDALFHAPRQNYKLIQTPEAFHYHLIKKQFDSTRQTTGLYEQVYPCDIAFINLPYRNIKITYPKDIYEAEQLMKYTPVIKKTSSIKDLKVLILGGTGGIGQALYKQLMFMGAHPIAWGSHEKNLSKEGFETFNPRKKFDCVVYAAGAYATDNDGLIDQYDTIMTVNFKGLVSLVENAYRIIKQGGNIVVIGSTCAAKGREGISVYSASKAALNAFVEAIAEPLKRRGLYINAICPAKVATPLQTKINPEANQKDMIQPIDLAKIIAKYINTDITGNIVYLRVGEV